MTTTETYYYQCFKNGEPQLQRRLCRYDLDSQLRAAIEIAIAYSEGHAGYRNIGRSYIGEVTWYVSGWTPEGVPPGPRDTIWWMIPFRVDKRIMALYNAAIDTAIRANKGSAGPAQITGILKKWQRTGHWRRIASQYFPKRGEEKPVYKTKRRRANRMEALRKSIEARVAIDPTKEPTWLEKQTGFCVGDEVYIAGDLKQQILPNSGIVCDINGHYVEVETLRGFRKVRASSCKPMTPQLRDYLASVLG
jgi:hypothetical protein